MKGKSYGSSSYSSYGSSSKKVDNKLIAEDFKKYEDKATKKIKEGKISCNFELLK
jgi:hypothetical protein